MSRSTIVKSKTFTATIYLARLLKLTILLTIFYNNAKLVSAIKHDKFILKLAQSKDNTKKRHTWSLNQSIHTLRGGDVAIRKATLSAMSQMLSAISLGVIATKFEGVLDQRAIKVLSRLAYYIFQPAFLLCSVITTLAPSTTTSKHETIPKKFLWLITFTSLIQVATGFLVFQIISSFIPESVKESYNKICFVDVKDVRFCTTFANAGTLPFIITNALFKDFGPLLSSQINSCLSFFLLGWSPLFWTFGQYLLIGKSSWKDIMYSITSPPVMGSIFGIVIGSISSARDGFLSSPLFGAFQTLGTAYLPSAILVLSGSLASSSKAEEKQEEAISLFSLSSIPILSFLLLARYVLLPYTTFRILRIYEKLQLLPTNMPHLKSVISFVLLLQSCMPPSQNSVIVLQMFHLSKRASSMAKLLTATYVLSVVPIVLLLIQFMKYSQILSNYS